MRYKLGSMKAPCKSQSTEEPYEATSQIRTSSGGIVLFAHGSGSSRHSPRNKYVAQVLQQAGLATLLMDLLTSDEESRDAYTASLRFDIELLARRLIEATRWLIEQPQTAPLPIGYFGADTGAAAALVAVAELRDLVAAVVSRGGRPDLAGGALRQVVAPTLLIVGGNDHIYSISTAKRSPSCMARKDWKSCLVQAISSKNREPGIGCRDGKELVWSLLEWREDQTAGSVAVDLAMKQKRTQT